MNEHFNSTAMTSNDKKEYLVLITFSLWNLSLQGVAIVVFVRCKKDKSTDQILDPVRSGTQWSSGHEQTSIPACKNYSEDVMPCLSQHGFVTVINIFYAPVFSYYIFSACALSFDRFISLKYAFHYQRFTRPRALRLYFVCMILISLASFQCSVCGGYRARRLLHYSERFQSNGHHVGYHDVRRSRLHHSYVVCFCVYHLWEISKELKPGEKKLQEHLDHYNKLWYILTSHFWISSILNIFIFEKSFEENETLHQVSRIIISIFYITTPILFTCSFYESRYHFIRIVCCCSRKILTLKEMEHKNHYATYEIATVGRGFKHIWTRDCSEWFVEIHLVSQTDCLWE